MSIFIEESMDETKKEYGFLVVDILSRFEDEIKTKILDTRLNHKISNHLRDMDYDYSGLNWDNLSYDTDLTSDQVDVLSRLQTVEEFTEKCIEFLGDEDELDERMVNSFAYHLCETIQNSHYQQLNELNGMYKDTTVKLVTPRIIYNLYSDSYFYESSRC